VFRFPFGWLKDVLARIRGDPPQRREHAQDDEATLRAKRRQARRMVLGLPLFVLILIAPLTGPATLIKSARFPALTANPRWNVDRFSIPERISMTSQTQ
jgi:hypothetical protein